MEGRHVGLDFYGHFNKSEMALFSECTDRYAQNMLDTADIVREAILQQLARGRSFAPLSTGFNLRGDQNAALCNLRFAGVPKRGLLATF